MDLMLFLAQTILISFSGAMAPGPVSAVAIGKGNQSPWAGVWIALGHGMVEVPIIAALICGWGYFLSSAGIQAVVGFVGGGFLIWVGIDLLRSWRIAKVNAKDDLRNPVWVGALLSLGNPYFLLWWAAVGMTLITKSRGFGSTGMALFVLVHWFCDVLWMTFLSQVAYRGGQFFGKRLQRLMFVLCGMVVIFFGVAFIVNSLGK